MAREKLDTVVEDDAAGTDEQLHVKYRPRTFAEVRGQKDLVRSLKAALELKARPHGFLFTGDAGCGKTSIARIVAKSIGVVLENIIEVDAATKTGIDAMREVTDTLRYKGFGDSPLKMVIVDEAHRLSKNAWDSLLKILEEPPTHVYFCFCSTAPGSIPETIMTRCTRYTVKSLTKPDLFDLVEDVCKLEDLHITADILDEVVRVANGSPRRALTALAMVTGIDDPEQAAKVLSQPWDSEDVIELCRALLTPRGPTWEQVQGVLLALKDEDPEGLRLTIVNYLTAVVIKTKEEKRAAALLDILSAFMKPCNRSEKMAPLLIMFSNLVLPQPK